MNAPLRSPVGPAYLWAPDEVSSHLVNPPAPGPTQGDPAGVVVAHTGVAGVRQPVLVVDRSQVRRRTVAAFEVSVARPSSGGLEASGPFLEVLEAHRGELSPRTLPTLLREVKRRMKAEFARVQARFPYFVERPLAAGGSALSAYDCYLEGEASQHRCIAALGVACNPADPCGDIPRDRPPVSLEVGLMPEPGGDPGCFWLEELIDLAQGLTPGAGMPAEAGPGERLRQAAARLQSDVRVSWFRIQARDLPEGRRCGTYTELRWRR